MKIKTIITRMMKALLITVGWTLMILGGLLTGICAICALAALFGGLKIESFGERLGFFVIYLVLMCVSACVLIEGRWVKNGMIGRKQGKPAVQKAPEPACPEAAEEQRRLEEIDQAINAVAGSMDMHTTAGERYRFILSGLGAFNPNRSSMCGYGCDDWMFHCSMDGEDYILNVSDEASYGRCWSCVAVSREDAQRLQHLEAVEWLRLIAKCGRQILRLHPDHPAEVRAAMGITSSRCGPISDEAFYGL